MKLVKYIVVVLLLFATQSCSKSEVFIRVSQVGFLKNDIKIAIILSNIKLDGISYQIINSNSKAIEYKGKIENEKGEFGNFKRSYEIDFSKFQKEGSFRFEVDIYTPFHFDCP